VLFPVFDVALVQAVVAAPQTNILVVLGVKAFRCIIALFGTALEFPLRQVVDIIKKLLHVFHRLFAFQDTMPQINCLILIILFKIYPLVTLQLAFIAFFLHSHKLYFCIGVVLYLVFAELREQFFEVQS
jgi:hypothetical protein